MMKTQLPERLPVRNLKPAIAIGKIIHHESSAIKRTSKFTDSYFVIFSSDSDDESDADLDLPTKSMSIAEREKALIDISWMDDEEGKLNDSGPLRTKNEIENIVVQRPTVTIKPEAKIVEIGTIYAVVENTVVVQGHVSGDEQVLDSGSLFVFEDREILGEVKYQIAY
jgi:hypothetical protein